MITLICIYLLIGFFSGLLVLLIDGDILDGDILDDSITFCITIGMLIWPLFYAILISILIWRAPKAIICRVIDYNYQLKRRAKQAAIDKRDSEKRK